MKNNQKIAKWQSRRRIIIWTLIFCGGVVTYCLHKVTPDTQNSRILETAINASFALAGTIIASYVFGAVWQDVGKNSKDVSE